MAEGQAPLSARLDVAALSAAQALLERLALDRGAAHAARLRGALELHRILSAAQAGLATTSQLALMEQTSEFAATALLEQARLLSGLPGAVEAVECGLLTVEQCTVLTRKLLPLDGSVRLGVWHRLRQRLLGAADGTVLPPARLTELLSRWIKQVDAEGEIARRKGALSRRGVEFRRRSDDLHDLGVNGLTGPIAQAILSRIRDRARPWGAADDRTADQRRHDAAVDLLLGRDQLPLDDEQNPFSAGDAAATGPFGTGDAAATGPVCSCDGGLPRHVTALGACEPGLPAPAAQRCGGACGCRSGEPVPCGVGVSLLIPLGAALGTTDELAELEGHGPLDADLAQAVLHTAPVIRPVWVDEQGTPVAIGHTTESPPRGDPDAVREALLRLAASPPTPSQPRHPDDHPAPTSPPSDAPTADGTAPSWRASGDRAPAETALGAWAVSGAAPRKATTGEAALDDGRPREAASQLWQPSRRARRRPRVLTRPHPFHTPGPYRVPTRLARLLRVRAPRCEWPGCGHRAAGCDLDHDRAHPDGPTCACNLGPLCRRHHRIKQLLMSKHRDQAGVHWTDPTGRSWLSPSQHDTPQPAVRPVPALPDRHGLDEPEEDGSTDYAWLDGTADRLRADEPDHDGPDRDDETFQELLDDPWGITLDDPTRWAA